MERRVRDSATFCKQRLCSNVFQRVLLCYIRLYSVYIASLVMYGATPSFANIYSSPLCRVCFHACVQCSHSPLRVQTHTTHQEPLVEVVVVDWGSTKRGA